MAIKIESVANIYDEFAYQINERIDREAKLVRMLPPLHYYAFQATDDGKESGGIFGFDNFGALHIEGIWVNSDCRLKGIGRSLVMEAEALAEERECKCISLFTMDFQAVEFYKAMGYLEEFRRIHYHNNSEAVYMIKLLNN